MARPASARTCSRAPFMPRAIARGNNYVALNCAAMPESLIDAELFGYEAGAFTGARRDGSKGLIVQADGGTLFLDEIGDMPIALQTRLLRVLENREVWPLGALKPVPVDIRLISATHRDLGRMAEEGSFPRRPLFPSARHGGAAAGLARARATGTTSSARSRARRRRMPAVGGGLVDALGLSLSPATCASSATCCGSPAARRRMASSPMPISICRRSVAGRRSRISQRPSARRSSKRLRKHGGRVDGGGACAEAQPRHALSQDQGDEDRDGAVATRLALRENRSSSDAANR